MPPGPNPRYSRSTVTNLSIVSRASSSFVPPACHAPKRVPVEEAVIHEQGICNLLLGLSPRKGKRNLLVDRDSESELTVPAKRAQLDQIAGVPSELVPPHLRHVVPTIEIESPSTRHTPSLSPASRILESFRKTPAW